jgi:hypothetical protein
MAAVLGDKELKKAVILVLFWLMEHKISGGVFKGRRFRSSYWSLKSLQRILTREWVILSIRLQCTVYFMAPAVSRGSSVDIATGYRLDGRSSFPGRVKDSSLLHRSQTGSGTSVWCWGQEWWSYTSTPHTSSWRCALLNKYRERSNLVVGIWISSSACRMKGEWYVLKGLEGSGRDRIEELSRNMREGTEKNVKVLGQDSRYPGGDSNRAPPEQKARLLPLH